jgi:hypothetical protein
MGGIVGKHNVRPIENEDGMTAFFSPAESRRFNRKVVRFEVDDCSSIELKRKIVSRDPDLAIVRIPTHRLDIVNHLFNLFSNVLLGDCLVMYSIDLKQSQKPIDHYSTGLKVIRANRKHLSDLNHLVHDSFQGYRNHYCNNPSLAQFDLTPAYQEWARSCVVSPDNTCFLFFKDETLCGFFTAQTTGTVYRGLLSGVAHNFRNIGTFRKIIKSVKSAFLADGAHRIVTFVLLENRPVHGVLSSEGFRMGGSFYTAHINFRVPGDI